MLEEVIKFEPPREEVRVEREAPLVEQRVKFARTCLLVEEALSKKSEKVEPFVLSRTELSPEIRERLLDIIAQYRKKTEQTEYAFQRLQEILLEAELLSGELDGAAIANDLGPSDAGRALFIRMMGLEPRGSVFLSQLEGYILMDFSDESDLQAFTQTKGIAAGGWFQHEREFVLQGERFPVVSVNSSKGNRENDRLVLLHERQHFVNQKLLGFFYKDEPAPRSGGEIERIAERKVKDEVLAYMRNGSSGQQIQQALGGHLYLDLFDDLNEDEKSRIHQSLQDIAMQVDTFAENFASEAARGLLVYALIDVPLSKMPNWIRAIGEHLESVPWIIEKREKKAA